MTQQNGMKRNRVQRLTTQIEQKEQHFLRLMKHDKKQETVKQSSHNEEGSKVLLNYRCDWPECSFKPTNRATNLTSIRRIVIEEKNIAVFYVTRTAAIIQSIHTGSHHGIEY